ncbi:MAG: hypothetical protein JWP02_2021 [Acidimicrobiales bacterium]|nr:hypothetical protein [Acidimicrobiales bacterium]
MTRDPSGGGSVPPGATPPAPPIPVPPGHLDRLVPVFLAAAVLRAASTAWAVADLRFPNVSAGDRARLFSRNLGATPGLLVLLAAVLAALWSARIVAFTPRLTSRARMLFLTVAAVATFVALGQLVGLVWDLTPDRLPFEGLYTRGPAVLDQSSGLVLSAAAVALAAGRLRAL